MKIELSENDLNILESFDKEHLSFELDRESQTLTFYFFHRDVFLNNDLLRKNHFSESQIKILKKMGINHNRIMILSEPYMSCILDMIVSDNDVPHDFPDIIPIIFVYVLKDAQLPTINTPTNYK